MARGSAVLTRLAMLCGADIAFTAAMLEDVVITALRKAELLQDAPISFVTFLFNELEKGISSLVGLRADVPKLQFTPHPNSTTTARMDRRGVGNNDDQITQDLSGGVCIDGVYLARHILGEEYYIARFNALFPSAVFGEPRSDGIAVRCW